MCHETACKKRKSILRETKKAMLVTAANELFHTRLNSHIKKKDLAVKHSHNDTNSLTTFHSTMSAAKIPIRQNRTLFNSKFEGYKLSFLEESHQHFVAVGAPGPGVVVPKLPATAKLSYRQVQNRIRHNHLHPGWNSFKPANGDITNIKEPVLFAVDEDYVLIALQFDKVRRQFTLLRKMIKSVKKSTL